MAAGQRGGPAIINKLFAWHDSKSLTYTYDGRLPVTWLKNFDNGPGSKALFPYGYGCSTLTASTQSNIRCDVSTYATSKAARV